MTKDQKQMTLAIADNVLREEGANRLRVEWAKDAIAALRHGDRAAAARQFIPFEALPVVAERKAA